MKPSDRIYWSRTLLAILAGLVSAYLAISMAAGRAYALGATLAVYLASYALARFVVASDLPRDRSREWYTKGIGTFIVMWLWVWILLYTLLG